MKRDYFLYAADGQQKIAELAMPIRLGGKSDDGQTDADIQIPGLASNALAAIIGLSEGHAFVQPGTASISVYHNDERLQDSAWLKSGDRLQIADSVVSWDVQGDKVILTVREHKLDIQQLKPPRQSYQAASNNDPLPVTNKAPTVNSGRHIPRWLLVLVAVLVVLAGYLLMSTSVRINPDPDSARVELSGFPPPIPMAGSRLVFPGNYQLHIQAEGYEPLDQDLDIAAGPAQILDFKLAELPGLLQLQTDPQVEIQLFVDGLEVTANAEHNYALTRGPHALRVESERYLPASLDLEVAGFGASQNLEVNLQRAWAVVDIQTLPVAAEVLVDNQTIGVTPLAAEILQGEHELKIQLPGFKPVIQFHTIVASQDFSVPEIELIPVDGKLQLSSQPAGASILVDDKFMGTTPQILALAAEMDHRITLSKSGYSSQHKSLRLAADETRELRLDLAAEYGTVFLQTTPAGAAVLINGRPAKQSNGRIRLQTIQNTIKVSKNGYVSKQVSLTPKAGVSQNLSIHLVSVKQQQAAKKAAATPEILTAANQHSLRLIKPENNLKMGASRRDAGRRANESQRLIGFKRPFYMGLKEVSNAQYRQFKSAHNSGSGEAAPLNGEQQPVVNLSWDDAARYCNWLSQQQGLPAAYQEQNGTMQAVSPMTTGYRLPSEAEWAWVARRYGSSAERRYPWAGSFPPSLKTGNYADSSISDSLASVVPNYNDGFRASAPVASFPASAGGFYDLGGNVAEWMHDYYAVYPGEASKLVSDPLGPSSGSHHVVRGASWREGSISELRLSYRDYSAKARDDLGFRVARYAE